MSGDVSGDFARLCLWCWLQRSHAHRKVQRPPLWRRLLQQRRCVVCGDWTGPADTYVRIGDGSDPVHGVCRRVARTPADVRGPLCRCGHYDDVHSISTRCARGCDCTADDTRTLTSSEGPVA